MTDRDTPSAASVTTSQRGDVVVAVVTGELDMVTTDRVGTTLFEQVDATPLGLVVDLNVTFLASSGLSMLLTLHGRAMSEGVEFVIVPSSKSAGRPLALSGFTELFPMAESVEDAVAMVQDAHPLAAGESMTP